MDIVAKVYCGKAEDQPQYDQKSVSLHAVIDGSEENKSFAKFTPSMNVEMWISNETPASEFFEKGAQYYVTFTKAE